MRTSGFDPALAEIIGKRLKVVTIFIVVIISVLLLRLWFLQIIKGPSYRVQSENNRIHLQSIPPFRGLIFDRNGELLVDNRPSYDVYIIPEDVHDSETLYTNLNRLIPIDPDLFKKKIKRKYSSRSFEPVLLKRGITREELARVEVNLFNLPGVFIEVKPQRNYIYSSFASHIVGYLGEISESQLKSGKYKNINSGDMIGKYGIENIWQNQLNGERGGRQVEVDASGRKLRTISQKPAVPGYNIFLTIDKDLQSFAEESLKDKTGTVIALDPNNGEVLAMVNSPAFDPNKFVTGFSTSEWSEIINNPDKPLQNRVIRGQYPAASVFKIVTALAGLEEGEIDPEEKISCVRKFRLGDSSYSCWKLKFGGHGAVNLKEAIMGSCDIYFYKIGQRLGIDKIARYARMFGLGEKTGIDLNGEKEGLMPDTKWKLKAKGIPWQQGETLSCAIGQSYVTVTPIQMANLISTVFNGGNVFQPKVVKKVMNGENKIYEVSPKRRKRIHISKDNLEMVKEALIAVVNDPAGTAYKKVRIKGVTVAGKSGTAQVVNLEKVKNAKSDGEVPSKYEDHAWFVAIAPAEKPEIAVAVLVEHGGGGSDNSGPVARDLIKHFLNK